MPAKFLTVWEPYFAIHIITESYGDLGARPSYLFEKGDSSSWIVDLDGRLVAMLHSGLQDGPDPLDFASPIKDNFGQTERKIGHRVELSTNWTTRRDVWLAKAKEEVQMRARRIHVNSISINSLYATTTRLGTRLCNSKTILLGFRYSHSRELCSSSSNQIDPP